MTRKDYVAIAAALRCVDNRALEDGDADTRETVAEIVALLSQVLREDNPRFDARRFAAACGVLS